MNTGSPLLWALQECSLHVLEEARGSCPLLLPVWGLPQTPLHPHPRLAVLAGTHREFDLLGPVSILEGVVGVLVGQAGGADGSDHHSSAVAPDGVLEEAGQLAVPVWHVRLSALGTVSGRGVSRLDRPRPGLGSFGVLGGYFYIHIFKNLFIWLYWVLVVACGI